MRFQYSTSTLLLVTAVVGIIVGSIAGWVRMIAYDAPPDFLAKVFVAFVPVWLPLVFIAFIIGRKKLGVRMVIAFAAAELATFGFAVWMIR